MSRSMSSAYSHALLLASVAALASLCTAAPLDADSIYTYSVIENLPCVIHGCSGNVGLSGTLSVNQLSTLTDSNFTSWNLSIVYGSASPITLNQLNSSFTLQGNPVITATATNLTIDISETGDSFMFVTRTAPVAQWVYGAVSAPVEAINASGIVGLKALSLPSTFTAARLGGGTEAPEPAASLLVGLGVVFLLARSIFVRRSA